MRLLMIICTLILSACIKKPVPTSPVESPDPIPVVLISLESASSISAVAGQFAQQSGDYVGCVTGLALSAALTTARDGVAGNIEGGLIPGVDLDVGVCLDLAESQPEGEDVPALVQPLVDVGLQTVKTVLDIYGSQIDCAALAWTQAGLTYAGQVVGAAVAEIESPDGKVTLGEVSVDLADCEPAPEEPAPEEAPVEEPAPEEPAPEELAPEEPAPEEPAPEEAPVEESTDSP